MEFEYYFPDIMEGATEGIFMGAAGILTGILLMIWFVAMGFSIVCYVLGAVGKYRIAKRRGIHHAWLAWIPVGADWLAGSISDHYQYVAKQKVTKRRKILLILSIVLHAMSLLTVVLMALAIFAEGSGSALLLALTVVGDFVIAGLSITVLVFSYIAHYDLYQSCKPNCSVLFLVLSILFSVTQPFFVFACSGSDQGMPARRPKPQPVQDTCEIPQAEEEEIPVVEAELVEDSEL